MTGSNEPKIIGCTIRDGEDEWHIECRFSDGQKLAAVLVDKEFPQLAEEIAQFLNSKASNGD